MDSRELQKIVASRPELCLDEREEIAGEGFLLVTRSLVIREAAWWQARGVAYDVLDWYRVRAVHAFCIPDLSGKYKEIRIGSGDMAFALPYGERRFRIFRPNSQLQPYLWLGAAPDAGCFGWEQLPATGSRIVIASHEFGVLKYRSGGTPSVSPFPGSGSLAKPKMRDLKNRFAQVEREGVEEEWGLLTA